MTSVVIKKGENIYIFILSCFKVKKEQQQILFICSVFLHFHIFFSQIRYARVKRARSEE